MADDTPGLRIRHYMVGHKGVTFQSMARSVGVHADVIYDLVNEKSVKAAVLKKVNRWLDEHRNDPEKIRFK